MSSFIRLSSRPTQEYWEIPVLFEDDHLMALDKPAGLLVSPDHAEPSRPSLMALLHEAIRAGAPWAVARGITYLANAHRLGFETSGVLLLAKSRAVLVALADDFGSEQPVQTYLALVQGQPRLEAFEVNAKLAPHPHRSGRMCVDPRRGKKSATSFRLEESFAGYSLLRCFARTSRLDQIRAHLQSRRLPIVGDTLYGGRPLWLSRLKRVYRLKEGRVERPLMGRVALHSAGLKLRHPVAGDDLEIVSPWPKDLRVAVKYLRLFAPPALPAR